MEKDNNKIINDIQTIKEINKYSYEISSIESWAAWCEGEEGWGDPNELKSITEN